MCRFGKRIPVEFLYVVFIINNMSINSYELFLYKIIGNDENLSDIQIEIQMCA